MANRRRSLPPVSPRIDREIRPLLSAVTELLEVGEGLRGDPRDRKLTLGDLLDIGLVQAKAGAGRVDPGSVERRIELPPPNLATPPPPTSLSVSGGFNGLISLTWDIPGSLYGNHAYTNIYRAEADNFANARIVGREAGAFFTDNVRDDTELKTYYYWITFVSTADVEGPPNAAAGTPGQALEDTAFLLQKLSDQINENQLAGGLEGRINLIDGPATLAGSVANRISAEAQARIDAIAAEQGARAAAISAEQTARQEGDSALAQQVTSLTAVTDQNAADILSEQTARADADSALAQDITTLFAQAGDNAAAISQESTARADADSALASDVQTLFAATGDNAAAISAEQTARTSADNSLAQDIVTVQSNLSGDIATVQQSVNTEVARLDGRINSTAEDITTVQSALGSDIASVQQSLNTEISRVDGELTAIGATATLKLDVNGLISGYTTYNDGQTAGTIWRADTFALAEPGESEYYPFLFDGGVLYLDEARIRQGSIEEGQLGAITFGKLVAPDGVTPITTAAGLLKADYIDVDNLSVAEAATFFGDAASANYLAGSAGWQLLQNGDFEANNAVIRGYIEVLGGALDEGVSVSGSTIGAIRNEAEGAAADIQNWRQPGTTFIDGEKIFTGKAYVNTLQIKDNAVTVPAVATTSNKSVAVGWSQVLILSYNHEESFSIPVLIQAQAFVFFNTYSNFSLNCRIYVDGVYRGENAVEINLTGGLHNIELKVYRPSGFTFTVKSAFLSVLGVKR
ncbi:hypothetical protein [uncultured Marinobacter sp.]|uniref:phage tail tip fiber protein n=1 Tax=uncultured Marinobacter sp. TaxID=187379 RepID=UPI0025896006|nr:hypothetical protein [uncultured Marinobacter sp.]